MYRSYEEVVEVYEDRHGFNHGLGGNAAVLIGMSDGRWRSACLNKLQFIAQLKN